MKIKLKIKRLLATGLIAAIILPLMPIGELKAYAFEQDNFKVDEVVLIRNFDRDQNSLSAIISIRGEYLRDAPVRIFTNKGGFKDLPASARDINDDNILQYRLSAEDIGSKLYVGNKEISLDEENMPNITSITTKKVEEGQQLKLQGTNLSQIYSGNIKVYLDRQGETDITSKFLISGSEATISDTRAKTLGQQSIVFKKTDEQYINFNPANPSVNVKINITYTYQDQFLLYRPIEVQDLVMRPNRGTPGDTVYFESPVRGTDTDLSEYDVFFLKSTDGTDTFRLDNKGKNRTFQAKVRKDNTDYNILTVQVPDRLPVGEYFVVLTNVVAAGLDPMNEINREIVLEQKFRIIDSEKKSSITMINPSEGPDTGGTTVTIIGKFFGSLNIDEFAPAGSQSPMIQTPTDSVDPKELVLTYGGGTYGEGVNAVEIDRVERKIKVLIGVETVFLKNENEELGEFDPVRDTLLVRTGQVTDPGLKRVMVETTTTFFKSGGGTIEIWEIADNASYNYIAGQIKPEISAVSPELIQLVQSGMTYQIPEDRILAIHGTNLMIHKYVDDNGIEKLIYPEIRIGNLVLDKNKNPNLDVKIIDENGKLLDGTKGNELGVKILVTLPMGMTVSELGKKDLMVTNPTRNSEIYGLFDKKENFIEFVSPRADLIPVIREVKPYTSPLEGGEQIAIEGSNFQPGVKVFLDGEEITSIKRQEDGKLITFTSPKGREGETQLQVMNIEGGMAIHPFIYVKTYSDPKIVDFAPKKGNTGTLVMVKGDFFIRPEPIGASDNIFKLIGSRILLGGEEINDYNRNPNNKNLIELKPFTPSQPVFKVIERRIELEDYYDGILLKDENGRDYVIERRPNGEILISDGGLNIYNIELDINNNIIALRQGGEENQLTVYVDHLVLTNNFGEDTTLTYFTPYTTSGDKIIGKRVKVIDSTTIYFTVPILPDEKYYDLTVINPDTKKDSKTGNSGFYYLIPTGPKPKITNIVPNEGSVEGGYSIDIIGNGFPRVTDTKPKVFINAIEIPEKDIETSPDGRAIRVLSVPRYVGDLIEEKGTSRWGVPVVVLNPDGSTDSLERGFFYVVPSSKPLIKRIDPNAGTAAGGSVIKIIGEQFRFHEPYDDKNRNGQLDEDEGETYNDVNKNGRWDDLNQEGYKYTEEWEEAVEKLPLDHEQYDYYYSSPILPKIYFGNEEGKIVEFEEGYIEVIAPKNIAGKADVYLLNNDGGISNKVPFTYESTPVTIRSMIPNVGPKEGGSISNILGSGFSPTEIEIYKDSYTGGQADIETKKMPLVRFGDRTNEKIPWDKENGGGISVNKAKVNLPGGLTVDYNGDTETLTLSIREGDKTYSKIIQGYDNDEKYIPVNLLKSEGTAYDGKELVKVSIDGTRIAGGKIINGKLLVERGYAPAVTFINTTEIRIDSTPSYNTVGSVPVIIINNEGGKGETRYEYKNPDSNPRITNIRADSRQPISETRQELDVSADVEILRVNHRGSSIVTVEGIDFRPRATIQIGGLVSIGQADITLEGSTSLTFKMPILPDSTAGTVLPLLVQNEDGASHSSDQRIPKIFIEITKGETNPEISDVEPDKGPATGGTRVKIKGTDIRNAIKGFEGQELRVYFGDIEADPKDIFWNALDRSLEVISPNSNGKLGQISLKVDNPDGERTQDGIYFEYISKPTINSVSPNKLFINDTETEISIEGMMFQQGAKVLVGATIVDKKDIKSDMDLKGEGIIGVVDGVNREVGVLGGVESATIKVESEKSIKITLPETKDLDKASIIIINPDGGISDPYDKFRYEIPRPLKPMILEAIPGYESTVRLIWNESDPKLLNGATDYEIFGGMTKDKENTFIGGTRDAEFLVRDLEPETDYTFMVRALNEYGTSLDFATVTVRTLSLRQDPKQKEKEEKLREEERELREKGKEEIVDGRYVITLGSKAFRANAASIDLTLSKYKNQDRFTIAIPLELARKDNRITIKDGSLTAVINSHDLYTLQVSRQDQGDQDAYVRIHIDKTMGTHLPLGKRAASRAYELDFDYIYGRNTMKISQLVRNGLLFMEQDTLTYPSTKNTSLYSLQIESGQYKDTKSTSIDIREKAKFILLSDK